MGGAGDVNSLAEKALTSPGVTVLTGPPGAGKTAVALELYRRRLDEIGRPGCLLIVPNAPAAEQTRRRLLEASPSALLIAPAVATFAQLASAVLSAAGTRAGRLGPAQRRLLLEAIVAELHAAGKLGALSPLADAPGLIDALDAAIAELKRAAVEPEALTKAIDPRSKKDADLLAVYRLYQQRLQQAGRFDLEGQMWLARDVLAGDDAPLGYDGITAVAADGFTDFTPTQLEMLAHLARRTEKLLITLPLADEPGRGRMWFWTARTLERIGRAIPGADVLALDSPAPLAGLFDLGGEARSPSSPRSPRCRSSRSRRSRQRPPSRPRSPSSRRHPRSLSARATTTMRTRARSLRRPRRRPERAPRRRAASPRRRHRWRRARLARTCRSPEAATICSPSWDS